MMPPREPDAMQNELPYHAMKLGALVALRTAAAAFCLAGAKLAEVLDRLGHDLRVELHLDAAKGLTWMIPLEPAARHDIPGGNIPPRATSKKQTGFWNDAVAMICRLRSWVVGMRLCLRIKLLWGSDLD